MLLFRANQWEVVKLLVQKGMKLSGINHPKEKQTLLHLACIHGTEEYVKWLAEQYADALFQENAKGETPLHLTIIFNKFENFKVLLSFKFMSSHILSRIGADALLKLSIQHRRVNCVQFLLAHGIQILSDHLELVGEEETSDETTSIKQLLSTQIEKQKLLFQAIKANKMSGMETLINEGVCINALDEQGHTPFYYAVKLKYPQLVAFLLHHGADRSSAASLETFSEDEINQIGQSGLDYLQKSSRAIIGYLNYHTYSAKPRISTTEQTCSPFSMENVYEALYAPDRMDALLEIKYFRPIMEVLNSLNTSLFIMTLFLPQRVELTVMEKEPLGELQILFVVTFF